MEAGQRDRVQSKPKRYVTGLEDAKGRPVSTAEILRHIAQSGSRSPAFVSHRRDQQGARSFFVNWFDRRPTVDAKRRTGEATRTGAHAADFRALEEHMVRGQGVVDAVGVVRSVRGPVRDAPPDGKPFTYAEAVAYADRIQDAPDAVPMVPVRVVPARVDPATRERVLDRQGTAAAPDLESLTVARLDEALKEPPGGQAQARNVVLVPEQQVKRFRDHQTTSSGVGAKLGQAATGAFRGTVLPFSTKWMFGNIAEAALRLTAAGVTPRDVVRGRRVMGELRKLDDQAWKEADTRIRGGLLYGSADRLSVHRGAEDFEGTFFEHPAKTVAGVGRLPVVRQIVGGLQVYRGRCSR